MGECTSCCSGEAGFRPYQRILLTRYDAVLSLLGEHEAARFHRWSGWCGCGMAARGASAAVRPCAAHRRAHEHGRGRSGSAGSLAAFQQGLQQLGWIVGRNVRIDTRWGGSSAENIRRHAVELVALTPDVILATGSVTVGPLLQTTRSVPIVFAYVPDPVGAGFVDSLARPGRNATGFTPFEYSRAGNGCNCSRRSRHGVTQAAIIWDPQISTGLGQFAAIQAVAPSVGVEVSAVNIRDADEIGRASRHSRAPRMAV